MSNGRPRQFDDVRTALRHHQVVAFIGARGTGKTALADRLVDHLRDQKITVLTLDARTADSAADFNAGLGAALRCSDTSLSTDRMQPGERVRVVIERCEALYDQDWFLILQEQWRALFGSEAARGRLGLILFGRPLFQDVAGGDGSPLLNIGTVIRARPLTSEEVMRDFGLNQRTAEVILEKTGGHPALTSAMIQAIDGDVQKLGGAIRGFVREHERYLIRLVQDHSVAGMAILAELAETATPIPEAALVSAYFGSAFARGHDCLEDLEGSGLISRDASRACEVRAQLIRDSSAVRSFLRAPLAEIPVAAPGRHSDAAALLYQIENRLRQKVAEHLGQIDRAWWPNRIGEKIAAHAEARRQDEMESHASPAGEPHPIMYLHLMEVFDVVISEENWDQVFRLRFALTKDAIRKEAEVISGIRIKIAHNRPIDEDEFHLLEIAARRLRLDN